MDDLLLGYAKMLRRIRIALSDDYICSETVDGIPIRKLFISNLAERTTFKDLSNRFSMYGNIENCFLRRNEGKSNYAFITFSNVDDAMRAMKDGIMKKITLHNRDLRIKPANSRHQPDGKEQHYDIEKEQSNSFELYCMSQKYLQNDIQNVSIDILNDDCLSRIFQHLSILDRMCIEKVYEG